MKMNSITNTVRGAVKWFLPFYLFTFLPLIASAQPKARRVQQQAEQQQTQQKKSGNTASSAMTRRAQISFPTALDVPEDVVWRRDIYREIILEDDANAGLYYPVEPQGKQLNLFTYIFKLAQNGYIPIYEYPTDGSDVFEEASKVPMKTVLDNYHIFYEEQNGKLKVDNSDIPSAEVKKYYLKESAYYDQANSSFHIKVLALCPVMMRNDDFIISDDANSQGTAYPLFWVKYSDLEPFLTRQTVMTSSLNNAATMSMDDYFTMNKYSGKIYKTTNMLGRTLAQYCPDEASMTAEQKRIEEELEAFRKNIFGDPEKKDSLDSIANANPQNVKAAQKAKAKKARQNSTRRTKVSGTKTKGSSSSPSNGAARVSVRRERH
ncbi:MAG: gliding motility protein GldN [Prevotella sp.]|jgi:gliding motility associated protien GldN|nr:gliding motility protein GldN [Prevotella sp.]